MNIEILIYVIIFIFGLVFGSFYNVVGYRLPNNKSIAYPASNCPKCKHKLRFYELIPVLSYIFLKGKCSKCKEKISIIYPIFEFITGLLFLLSYISFGFSMKFIIAITFISILIIITISDIRYYIIPDEVLLIGIILVIFELLINSFINNIDIVNGVFKPILNGVLSFALLYVFKLLGDFLFKKESLGGGDIKLLFLIGLTIGFDMSIVSIFLASFIALPLSIIGLVKNNTNVLPFGPYLSISSIIILLSKIDLNIILNFLSK